MQLNLLYTFIKLRSNDLVPYQGNSKRAYRHIIKILLEYEYHRLYDNILEQIILLRRINKTEFNYLLKNQFTKEKMFILTDI